MGFKFASFGAATVPLSKIVVDKELDMGQYRIIADRVIADEVRARRVYSPIDTEEWETETLDWGDITPVMRVYQDPATKWYNIFSRTTITEFTTPNTPGNHDWKFSWWADMVSTTVGLVRIYADGVEVSTHNLTSSGTGTGKNTIVYVSLPPAAEIEVTLEPVPESGAIRMDPGSYIESYQITPKNTTFDLTGKWLALGLDMKGLAATVKIQGVEIPYSDYAKYFPIAPTEITIPGDWSHRQERPEIKVYK